MSKLNGLLYKVDIIPDLSLNKYASLEGNGIEGALDKHLAFLRQWNRKGVLSGTSIHLFFYYDGKNKDGKYGKGEQGSKLEILFLVKGTEDQLMNVSELVHASPLSDYFVFSSYDYGQFEETDYKISDTPFSDCSTLIKKEVFIKSSLDSDGSDNGYYLVPQWEPNEEGRLYGMCKLMESLDRQMLYRIDLYPVERNISIREALRKPMSVLRERQYSRTNAMGQRDYEADDVLRNYEELMKSVDTSPHFITNIFVFGNSNEDTAVVLDAAGAEALQKGSYEIASFSGNFDPLSFLKDDNDQLELDDAKKKIYARPSSCGLAIGKEEAQNYRLKYLPNLFTLEEVAPLFRFPVLYEGETVQKRKETAPQAVPAESGLFLGTDDNGYDVYFPLENLAKHGFISGVPGSGKTNTMHHLTSALWKKHRIPFLVLEPAKQEYRALANQPGMEDLHIFAPNADMLFPLHINPFEFPKGLMLAEHIRRLVSVFEGAFPLDNPMPFLLDAAIEAVYRDLGWKPDTIYKEDTKLKFPTMSMLYKRLEDELKTTTYSDEIRGNLESALKVRIGSLLRREMGDVFDVPSSTIAPEEWLEIPAIIELESMGTGPANFLTLMLCALIREALKVNPHHDKEYARHVIFIEEAHNLIGPESEEAFGAEANPKQAATAFVVKMLAEVRALKEGIIIADQLPTVMAQEVIKNTGLKIGLRITSADDRGLLGSTMAANALQLEEMATFDRGRSLVSYEGLMRPFTIKVHEWCGKWNIERCKDEYFDLKWCYAECEHYKNGDCYPEKEKLIKEHCEVAPQKTKRNEITISKRDVELAAMIRNRASYRKICEQSIIIDCKRFYRDFTLLEERMAEVNKFQEKVKQKKAEIISLEKKVDKLVKLSSEFTKDELAQIDDINELLEAHELYNSLKPELDKEYPLAEKDTYILIEDFCILAINCYNRGSKWLKFGVNIKKINESITGGNALEPLQTVAKNWHKLLELSLLSANNIFKGFKNEFIKLRQDAETLITETSNEIGIIVKEKLK